MILGLKRALVVTMALFLWYSAALAQNPKEVQSALLYLQFQQVHSLLKGAPLTARNAYFKVQKVAIHTQIRDQSSRFEPAIDTLTVLIKAVDKAASKDVSAVAYAAEMRLYRAMLYVREGSNLSAALDLRDAYRAYDRVLSRDSTHVMALAGMGIIKAGIGSLPSKYQSYISLIGMKGTVKNGLQLIRKSVAIAEKKEPWFEEKARVLLLWAEAQFLDYPVSKLNLEKVNFQSGLLARYLMIKRYLDHGEGHYAATFLKQHPNGRNDVGFPQLEYLKGRVFLSQLDPQAVDAFSQFLHSYKGTTFVKSAHRYLMWHHYLHKNTSQVDYHRKKVMETGSTFSGADQQALIDAKLPLNEALLIGRLRYDGGDYSQAFDVLSGVHTAPLSPRERAEYHYRMGRIYEKQKKDGLALVSMEEAVKYDAAPDLFISANAWLQLGYLYKKQGNKANAKQAFEACLKFEDFPFYEGMHQKAKMALDQLDESR